MPNFVPELFIRFVELGTKARFCQPIDHAASIPRFILGYRRNDGLDRRQPSGEGSAVMLDERAEEAFERPGKRAVNHDGTVILPVASAIFQLETFGQNEINLDRTKLPRTAERIANVDVELRTVEGAAAFVDGGGEF